METNTKNYISTIAAFVIGLVLGWILQSSYGDGSQNKELQRLQSQIEKAKQLFPSASEIRAVSGTIKSIKGNRVSVETFGSINPFEDIPALREVVITDATKMITTESKDHAEFQKEFEAYQKALRKSSQPGTPPEIAYAPPMSFREIAITIKDLQVGNQIFVEAGENIKTKTQFDATKITVQSSVMPLAVPAPVRLVP